MTLSTPLAIAGRTVNSITPRYADDTSAQIVTMTSPGMLRALILWKDEDYVSIGQWTDSAAAHLQALADSGDLAECFAP